MSPLIVNREAKQQQIVQAALDVFSKQGYTAASMRKISDAAGVGKSTLYEYFQSKTDVFVAAIQAWIDQMGRQMTTLMEKRTDPIEKIQVVAELANDIGSARNPAMNRLYIEVYEQMIVETGVLNHRGDLVQEMSAGIRRILTDVILHGISTGVFRADIARNAERIAINIMACVDGLLFNNLLGNQHFDLKWQVAFYLNNLIETIRVPMDTDTPAGFVKRTGA